MVSVPMRNYSKIQFLEINTQCFDILGEGIGVVTSIELNTLAAVLYERRKFPILADRECGPAMALADPPAETHAVPAQHRGQAEPFLSDVVQTVSQDAGPRDD